MRVAIEAQTEHGETLLRLWRHEGTLGSAAVADRVRWQLDGWLHGAAASRPTGGITRVAGMAKAAVAFLSLYTIPAERHDVPEETRLEPAY